MSTANAKHDNWLPSFNVKFDLTDKWVLRFAASKAMARPDIGLLKNYTVVTRIAPAVIYADEVANTTYTYKIQAGNPYLKPMTADQFDLALEHYFASVGSMTVTVFKKKFYDYVQSGTLVREVVNNGVERDVLVKMPMNGDGAEIEGVEFAYQRFFDFLPAPFDGLGMQANYTYVSNKGITTSQLISESADGSTGTAGGGVSYDETAVKPDALEGISPRSYNLIAMYEKNKLSMRLAYSWRSKFLVTAVDCCVGLPVWQDDAGFLDGSVRYRLTDKVELSLEGSNLLGTDTVLFQQVDNNGTLKPNAWFKNDRRAQVGLRLKF
ncbi:TonB-dependent receptor [Asticcacaulis sp. ZE23SCel15]|uniref:TonB-dependent receptor domain-containing protein n=1 Tax=Asticcacaulis sp. ZE23SCel15 TaxID=3059027 RepID=UPI00265FEFE1|nr:TonB-dependent receptor [Asticcacaulis sp. ZE23SCel15]WKL56954.1 TonB-dependent receptor [Asticcacaulis sp. ZE23SCel15]